MNEHDSERIAGLFESDGMTMTTDLGRADVVYINTCTIRENADNRLYGTLGQLKAIKDVNPEMMLMVGGCAAQKDRDYVKSCMVKCYEPGKIANWIAPPARGVNDQPFEFEYVKFH